MSAVSEKPGRRRGQPRAVDPSGGPIVSIVVAVRNAAATIDGALASAFGQTYPSIEVIVVDGASTDGTAALVEAHADRLAWWVSEPDGGIGDAWNKGIARSTGAIVVLLNADDALHPGFADRAVAALDVGRPMVGYGNTVLLDASGRTVAEVTGKFDPDRLDRGLGFWHTSCAITRAAYDLVGPFDPSIRIAVDTDWLLRAIRAGVPFVPHGGRNYMRLGGISTDHHRAARREYAAQLREYGMPGGTGGRRLRGDAVAAAVGAIGFGRALRWRRQAALVAIALFHLAYRVVPSWAIRRRLLALWGIRMDPTSAIHTPIRFLSRGRMTIGARTLINRDAVIDNRMGIRIGDDVSIAQGVRIFTLGHDVDDPYFAGKGAEVRIDDRAVIFGGAMIMPGAHIGEGAVVLPGAVVTGRVDDWAVVGGVPAAFVRWRSRDQRYRFEEPYHFQV
jgi:acetyltransferase-like isoleucine patch superfamily enzyme